MGIKKAGEGIHEHMVSIVREGSSYALHRMEWGYAVDFYIWSFRTVWFLISIYSWFGIIFHYFFTWQRLISTKSCWGRFQIWTFWADLFMNIILLRTNHQFLKPTFLSRSLFLLQKRRFWTIQNNIVLWFGKIQYLLTIFSYFDSFPSIFSSCPHLLVPIPLGDFYAQSNGFCHNENELRGIC